MKRLLFCTTAVGLLLSGAADATLVNKRDGKSVGPAAGGIDVGASSDRVRIQCWQDGRKIIDESDLAVVSLGIANQLNGMRIRRTTGPDGAVSVTTQSRTACLLGKHD